MPPLLPSQWLSNKNFKISLPLPPRRRRRGGCRKSPTTTPPTSPPNMAQHNRQAHEFREAFRFFDSDGDGKISSEELRAFFASMGDHISHDEATGVISDHDTDGDALLDFGDFVRLMERGGRRDDDLRRAFEMFEEVDKGSGCITPKGLQQMFNRLGDHKSREECEAMIRAFDLDGNGVLDFHEFHRMMA
ncbi:hypothetical protein ACLOJK_002892 [Asimina triloba]